MNPDLFAHAEALPPEPLTQAELDAVAAEHAQWLTSEGREGKRAALRGADLRACHFENLTLAEASFRNADMSGVTFKGCDLQGADFAESNLEGSRFVEVQLDRASFARSHAPGAEWLGARLHGAEFSGAQLDQARMEACDAAAAILRDAHMVSFQGVQSSFAQTILRGAILENASFDACDFTSAELRDVYAAKARFSHCTLQEALLRGANLELVDLSESDFSAAYEVEPVYYMHYIASERDVLTRERTALDSARAQTATEKQDLADLGEAVARDRQDIDTQMMLAEQLHDAIRGTGKFFAVGAFVWLLLSAAMLALVVASLGNMSLADLAPEELGLLSILLGLPLVLFVTATIRSFGAARALRHFREGDM